MFSRERFKRDPNFRGAEGSADFPSECYPKVLNLKTLEAKVDPPTEASPLEV